MIDARRHYFVINTQLYLFVMITSGLLIVFDSFINLLVINSLLIFSLALLLFMEIVRPSIAFFVAAILELYTPSMACKTSTLTICLIDFEDIVLYPLVNVFGMVAPLFTWSYHDDKQTSSNIN